MEADEIAKMISTILGDRFGIAAETLKADSRLSDMGIDSLHLVETMLDLEEALNIKVQDVSVSRNPTLGQVAEALAQLTKQRSLS